MRSDQAVQIIYNNKPTRITDPLGLVTTFSYDPATGNLLSRVADAGSGHFNATSRYTYNGYGHALSATDPLGTVTAFTYDGHGNPTTIIRDSGAGHLNQTTVLAYSPTGDVVALTDPNGHITTRSYDADRRLVQVTTPPAPSTNIRAGVSGALSTRARSTSSSPFRMPLLSN